ncbi:DUF4157 domain-containing protein [Streptomyces sp. TRM 70351]|uniref:eCIS core domain-containing protein n=1 Tax=Streptomyces sp. TRM 70351 TaxID=3116552 RepID=UPI002E7AE093|nr:DUF4157 domain-containing protein [Streptomyces sp. TRM 70351]MEE1930254.1 DUF4157 domain-containing protein [Streptomyces sp. TRM 70351]
MHAGRKRHPAAPELERELPQGAERASDPAVLGAGTAAAGDAGRMSAAAALALQRAVGNGAVARLVEQGRHQHGAGCGHPGAVQRHADDEAVQRDAMAEVDAVTRRPGAPMRADVRHTMESDYGGEDFGDVRVHVDRASAEAVGAKAYTTKTNHIVFRSPSDMDDHTMRHELQHVRQQRAGGVPPGVSHPADALERDAETTATRLGRGAADVQRSVAAGPGHGPAAGTGAGPAAGAGAAGGGAVQRMVLKTSRDFYEQWAGDGPPLTSPQKTWLWNKLLGLGGGQMAVRKLKAPEAVKLLTDNNVNRQAMEAELGPSAPAAAVSAPTESPEEYEERARAAVHDAEALWRTREPHMPRLETVTFTIEGLGRGTVAMLKSTSGPRYSNMLSWFSHGYEDRNRIAIDTERTYGFAVEEEKSLNRVGASADVFASLPAALAESGAEPTKDAPGMYVQPHHATELTLEIDRVIGLVNHCDVAVLMDFQWADDVAADFAEARRAETPPLPVIIEQAQGLRKYSSLLVYACRTPWTVTAAAEGSSRLKERLRKELMEQGHSADEARAMAQDRYEASPQEGTVYP